MRELDRQWLLSFKRKAHRESRRIFARGGFIMDQVQTMPFDQDPQFKADLACRAGVGIVADYTYGGVIQLPLRRPAIQPNAEIGRERTSVLPW